MQGLGLLIFFSAIAFLIAYFLGRKRQIGFAWSFFFCLFLSPIGGFITTMLSRKYYDPYPEPSTSKKIWGLVLIVAFTLSILGNIQILEKRPGDSLVINAIFMAIGFVGLGFYLIQLSIGKKFNSEAITKTDN